MLIQSPLNLSGPADVIVVGSGAVGMTLAARLASAGRRVVVIEAGRRSLDPEYQRHNGGDVSGRPYKGLLEGRYRGLGGTTRLWGGQLMRLSDGLLDPIPELGKPGWLIERSELARWEDEALSLLGCERAIRDVAEAWAEKSRISP